MPPELMPPASRGKFSYTVHVPGSNIVVEVLLKGRAFRTKGPRVVHTAWGVHASLAAAWLACSRAATQQP
jgi:hypothetical protein